MNNNIQLLEHGKTISIIDLPDCDIKSHLLDIVKDCTSKIIAIAHIVGSPLVKNVPWQVTISHPTSTDLKWDVSDNDYIKSVMTNEPGNLIEYGEVISEDIAIILFPEWKNREYKLKSAKE